MVEKFIVLDTETTNDIECPLTYDIGFAVIDKEGFVYEKHSFVVADIFLDKELMASAFFAEKIPMYWEQIKKGERTLTSFFNIRKILASVMKKYDTDIIIAHNARFDYISTATTQRYLTKSKYRYFFPYGTKVWDTLKMARETFKDDEKYCEFCTENDYKTSNNSNRYTAEILYRFLTDDNSFIESHTGLEDVLIEKEIFVECVRRNPEIDGKLW
jgi:DNA polymerase III epsilon subunit-like protein